MYVYFGVFSFFSGLYFLFQSMSMVLDLDLRWLVLLSAATYYGIFPWFIFEFVEKRIPKSLWFLSLTFLIAYLAFLIAPQEGPYAYWQIIAHIGLLGLVVCVVSGCMQFKKSGRPGSTMFILISVLFVVLSLEEIGRNYWGFGFPGGNGWFSMQPLDVYPLLFTLVMGIRMSKDFVNRKRIELDAIKNDLNEKRLRVLELEKLRLVEEVDFKKKDLTDFGIEITRKRNYIKEVMSQLTLIKKKEQIKPADLDEIIKFTKSQLKIGENLDYFQERIEVVNHEFNAKLKQNYPSLTENELHLASLLRLKLTTKEIANIKNISPDSVKVLRYRLRKKFQLQKETNLVQFLQKF